MNSLWLSHTFCEGVLDYSGTHAWGGMSGFENCAISVTLEGEARSQFSAIRLLIVSRKAELLANFFDHSDIMEHVVYQHFQEPLERVNFRLAHTRRRSRQQGSQALLAAGHSQPSTCTIVLEIVHHGLPLESDDTNFIRLVPGALPFGHASHLHVAFDHVQPVSTSKPSLFLFLGCNKFVLGPPGAYDNTPFHCMRVASSNPNHRPSTLLLSTKLIRNIVQASLGMAQLGRPALNWRAQLMSCGLVCRAWASVLDLFFEFLHEGSSVDSPNAYCVARSLETRPERATLIRSFFSSDFDFTRKESIGYGEQIMKVLEHATSVSHLELGYVSPHVTSAIVRIFPTLLQIHKCSINALWHRDPKTSRFSMGDFQTCIFNWQHLNELELLYWGIPGAEYTDAVSLSNAWPNLQVLTLSWGWLTGSQLVNFASPRLTNVHFMGVKGCSNKSLFTFLSLIASTITSIIILRCPMPKAENEEHALDAAMSNMIALTHLRTEGPIVSALTLSRKCVRLDAESGKPVYASCTIRPDMTQECFEEEEESTEGSITSPTVPAKDQLDLDEVAEAMGVTGWTAVSITWKGIDLGTTAWVQGIAEARNIHLECSTI